MQRVFPGTPSSIILLFIHQGNPAPEIEWYLNGNLIMECSKWRMDFYDDGTCSLTVQDAQEEDQGKVKCVAFNELGRTSCSASLYIEGTILYFL